MNADDFLDDNNLSADDFLGGVGGNAAPTLKPGKRPELRSIGSGLVHAVQSLFTPSPVNEGESVLIGKQLPPSTIPFDFKRSSAAAAAQDAERAYRAGRGVAGPVVGPQASVGSVIKGLVSDVGVGWQRTGAGVDRMIADAAGGGELSDVMRAQSEREYNRATLKQAANTPQFETDFGRGVYGGLSSLAQNAAPTAAAIATRSPGIALGGMVAPMVPQKYGEYRMRGETPGRSLLAAGGQAGVEYLTEKMPMGFLVNKVGRTGAGEFLTGLLAREIPGEQIATLVQDAIDVAVKNPDMTWGQYLQSRPSAAFQTLVATGTQAGVMQGANAGLGKLSRMQEQTNQPDAAAMMRAAGFGSQQPQGANAFKMPKQVRKPAAGDPSSADAFLDMPTLDQLTQTFQPGATVADDMQALQQKQEQQKPAGKTPDNVTRFAHSVRPAAERVSRQLGVPVEAVIGQWGLETGWGRSVIPGTNNLGNIKDFSGKGVQATDNMTGSRDKYRSYSSVEQFAGDFGNLLSNGRYRAVPGSKDAASYFSALKAAGYAEDPGYVGKGVQAAKMAAAALGKPFDPGQVMQFSDGQQQGQPVPMYGASQEQRGVEIRAALPDDARTPDIGPQAIPQEQPGSESDMFSAVLQNRDRSTPGSIAQMQDIAANPDYGRMGYSRDFANGAPVVAGGQIAPEQLGRQDMAVASDGRRIPIQYAVVEAGDVITSNEADGTSNASYADRNVPGIRAIAGNGRIAGVRAAYRAGRAQGYTQELIGDDMHGIDPGVVQRMQNPVLVRVMPQEAVTRDIGDVSNTVGNLGMTAVEQARNDAQRVRFEALQFAEDGGITAEAVRQFVRAMPTSEQGGMLDNNGQPTRQAVDRANAAVFAKAYGNDGLVRLYAQAQDPEARLILSALAQAAPAMSRLEGAGDLDIRELVTQAAEVAVNARRDGRTIKQAAEQLDLATDQGVLAVLDLFAANPRSSKPVADALQRAAQFAYTEANKDGTDMFGEVPRATRQDVLAKLNEGGQNGTVTEGKTDLGQPAGRKPDAVNAGQPAADAAGPADAGATETERQGAAAATESAAGAEAEGLTSYTPDEIVKRQDEVRRQRAQQEREDREAEQRARADAEVGEFTLTGSDLAADANPDQGLMFGRAGADATIDVDGVQRPTTNSNGQPIHPTEEGVRNFWRWFGDSKVVDAEGNPLVVYHGSPSADITAFDAGKEGSNTGKSDVDHGLGGFYFTPDPNTADTYARTHEVEFANIAEKELGIKPSGPLPKSTVYPVYLSIKNPLMLDGGAITQAVIERARKEGRDGVIKGGSYPEYVAFNPEQVKSATGNNGDFDPANPDIRRSESPTPIGTPVSDIRDAIRKAYGHILTGLERGGKVQLTQTEMDAIEAAAQARADKRGTSLEAERSKLMQSMQASRAEDVDIKRSESGAIQGFYDPATGKSFLIADNLTADAAPAVLLHEVGIHLSNDGTLDPLFARAKQLVDGVKGNPFIDRVRARMDSAGETSAEEAAAYMAEEYERDRLGAPNTVRQWIDRFIADVRAWLHKHGMGVRADNLTPADIAAIARANLRRAANAPVQDDAGVKASRSESTKAAYEARIDALFAGQPASRAGVRVLDRADVLDLLGFGDMSVVLREGKVILGQDNHPRMTADVWKKVPQWLDSPAAVFDSDTVPGALVAIGPELVDGNPVRITLEPNRKQNTLDVHLLTNAYDAGGKTPWLRWSHEGLARYLDKKTFPAILAPSGLQLPRVEQIMRGTGKILTEKNLAGYRKQQGDAPSFSRAAPAQPGQQQTPLPHISQQQPPSNNTPPPTQQMRQTLTGGGAPWSVDVAVDSKLEKAIRNFQNNKIDLKRVTDAVLATGKAVADNANPYLADELYIGRVTDSLEQMTKRQVEPLLKAISDAGIKPTELEQYLHARHAEERNRQMAKVNNHPFDQDYNMAGMSTKEANAIIQRVQASPQANDMQRLANMVYALTRATRVRLVQNGLATVDEINAWEGAYKHYVPLQRDVEESGGKAQGYNVKGNESRRAVGSTAEAKNILANVIAQAESSVVRSEKARVGRAMLQFAKDNPNPDFWTVNTPPTERAIDSATGLVVNRVVPNFMNRDNVLVVKVDGEEQYITFNEKNKRAVALVRNLKNMDVAEIGPVVETLGTVNRYLARWITTRNPFFWVRNFSRDVQGVVFNLQDTPIKGKELAIMASLPKAFAATAAAEFGNGGTGLMARYEREFSASGAKTGFMRGYDDSLDRMREIDKQIRQMGQSAADPRLVGRAVLDAIDGANEVVENMVRLAVYAQARQQGVSIDRSASIAKNITVNFNRKGNRTAAVNSLYMFANAGLQGNVRMLNAVRTSKRAIVYAGVLASFGAMLTTLNWFLSGDDDETRKRRYQLVPEWERERNWIIFKPGSDEYYKVPLPLGPHIFFNAGRVAAEAVLDADAKPLDLAASFLASSLASINPVGGGLPSNDAKGAAQMLTPSALRPVMDLAVNQSFTGNPISKEPSPYAKHQPPAYQRTRDKTPGYWKNGAELLNNWTGGDDVTPGRLNVTPEALAYIIKGYVVPGFTSAADKFGRAATADELKLKMIPGADTFFGRVDEAARNRAAWARSDQDHQKAGEAKDYLKNGNREKWRERLTELGDGDFDLGRKRVAMLESHDSQMKAIARRKSQVRKMPEGEAKDRAMENLDNATARLNSVYVNGTNAY